MPSKKIIILFLLFSINVFSQQIITISGKIATENKTLANVVVELQINKVSKFAVANNKGVYKFSNISIEVEDMLQLKVNYLGYKEYLKQLVNLQENNIVDIILTLAEAENLKEVVIDAKEKTIETVRKNSYKIDQKDFIKNTKASEILATVPNLYVDKISNEVIVEGKLKGKVFIDGIEAMLNELKTIDVLDIDRVEVISNPSSTYGSDFLGSVVNIIIKKKKVEFIKGSLGATSGIMNNYFSVDPSISYKRGSFIIKADYNFLQSRYNIDYNLFRNDGSNIFNSTTTTNAKNIRQYTDLKINVKLSEKSDFTFTNYYHQNKYNSLGSGYTAVNNIIDNNFNKNGANDVVTWKMGSVYKYKITENKNFYFKNSYAVYKKRDESNYLNSNILPVNFNIGSQNKEFTVDADFEAEELTIFKKSAAFYTDLKYINRNYSFSNTNYYIHESVISATSELDNVWSEKFSTESSLTLENTRNKNTVLNQNYNLALPTFNALYRFKDKYNAKFGYSRKVLRPSFGDLNDEVIIINEGIASQGNSNLDPQIRNYYSLTLSKAFKTDNISLKFFNESISNAIESVYKTQGTLLVQTLENAAKYRSTGMIFGLRTKLFKKINTNLNSGFDYSIFEDTSPNAVIKTNSGYTFTGNINLSTKFFKDKVSVSFSGRQNNPDYSLLSKRITEPYLDLLLSTNLLKGNLAFNVYVQNLLGYPASGFSDISKYNNFYQRIDTRNSSANILLTLTYNFGKTFNDKIDNNTINNDDVRR